MSMSLSRLIGIWIGVSVLISMAIVAVFLFLLF